MNSTSIHAMNLASYRPSIANRVMGGVVWTLQILFGFIWCVTGFGKACCIDVAVWNHMLPQVPWFGAVPRLLFAFIGVCEFLGGVGMIVPAVTGVKPKLIPIAAFGLVLIMIFAAVFHIVRGETGFFVSANLVLGGFTAFIGYERWFVRPIAPKPMTARRAVAGIVVWGALAFAGFYPVWYQLTHSR